MHGATRRQIDPQQRRLDTALDNFGGAMRNVNTMTAEEIRNRKIHLLAQAQALMTSLRDDGEDLRGIDAPNINHSLEHITYVCSILKLRDDRVRFTTIAEQMVQGATTVLEKVFNGEREFLGHRPNLTGWTDNVVRGKMRKARGLTGTWISEKTMGSNFNPMLIMMMDLLPSMVLYSNRQSQRAQTDAAKQVRGERPENPEELRDAMDALEDM